MVILFISLLDILKECWIMDMQIFIQKNAEELINMILMYHLISMIGYIWD